MSFVKCFPIIHSPNFFNFTSRLGLTKSDYSTVVRVTDTKRSDTGVYELTAKNINGTDTCTCKVTVLDVPGPPEGPVGTKDIRKDSATISWLEPKDNGGSPITHYIVEKQEQGNMRWVPAGDTRSLSIRVENLIEDAEYRFRIRAVNAQGEGGPLIGPDPAMVAKDPFKVPGRPGKPFAKDWSESHIDLMWDPPKYDGGNSIKTWIIERKTKFGIWEYCMECNGPVPGCTVTSVEAGMEYQFRIIAQNDAGKSEPGEPSDLICAEARFVAPWIDMSAMQDMVVCAGQSIGFNVPIRGAPKPTVTWKFQRVTITSDERLDIQVTRLHTQMDISTCLRTDSGPYSLEVTNEVGTASARANVTVLDRPARPDRPLKLSGITNSSCCLAWGESPDDGGSPITHYLVEKMDMSRGSWIECQITTELKTIVGNLVQGKEYMMRVKAVNVIGESDPLPLDNSFIAKNQADVPEAPGRPDAFDWDINHIDLKWNRPLFDGGSPIQGYHIQKKQKGTTIWTDACTISSDTPKGRADRLVEGEFYQFRVMAFNDMGNSAPSEPSPLIQARARYIAPKILTPLKDVNVKAGNNYTVDVEYIGSPDPNVNWHLEGSVLQTDERTTLSAIAPITTFHIVNCKRTDSGEMTLKIVNELGSDKASFFFNILDVPGPPTGPIVFEDITGNSVTITWKKPLDNGGSPITGYAVEKKDLDHLGGWVPAVNHIEPYTFTATVPRLLEGTQYEFRVFAINDQGRSIPLPTDEPVTARAQYDVPGKPGRPAATDADTTFISINWKPPSSNGGSQITGYDVERRDLLGGRWIRISTKPVPSTNYMDTDVTANHQYEYKVRAHNAAGPGLHSEPSLPITARPMKAAPKLDLDAMSRRIRVHAGEFINVKIPFFGSPLPTAEWTKEGKRVHTNRFNCLVKEDEVVFTIESSCRLDSGVYKLTLTNQFGSDTGNLTVTVLDRPEPPVGPVIYQNMDRDTIKLSWNPPEDDGGTEVTGYIVEKAEFGLSNWIACSGYTTTCEYIARSLYEGQKYLFRISAENSVGVSDPLTGKHIEARSPYDPPGPPGAPDITAYSPSSATLKWTPPEDTGGRPITGYYIEKREQGMDWTRVNHYPSLSTNYVVSGLSEGSRYEFRIIACNEAGPGAPSRPSEPIIAGVQKFPPGPPEGVEIDRITKSSITLSWRPPREDGGSKIIGYNVEMKRRDEEDFTMVTSYLHTETHLTVDRLFERKEYSFRVYAINDIGTSLPSRATPYSTVCEQANQPKLDMDCIKDIRVVEGEDFSMNINFKAFPMPTAQLWNEDVDLAQDSRVKMKVMDNFVSIILRGSVKTDDGHYR